MSDFDLLLTPEAVRTLYYAVSEAIRLWPGSPARPAEEQEELHSLKLMLFAMTMEMVIEKQDEDESPR